MKLNKKQKKILYLSILTILLMSLFAKKYPLMIENKMDMERKSYQFKNPVNFQIDIYN